VDRRQNGPDHRDAIERQAALRPIFSAAEPGDTVAFDRGRVTPGDGDFPSTEYVAGLSQADFPIFCDRPAGFRYPLQVFGLFVEDKSDRQRLVSD
jgi:hypothetical protein